MPHNRTVQETQQDEYPPCRHLLHRSRKTRPAPEASSIGADDRSSASKTPSQFEPFCGGRPSRRPGWRWRPGLETDRFGFRLWNMPECSPSEAVDISLQRLMRSRVSQRLQRERRLNASPHANRAMIDDELGRIREHPLYVMIKGKMTDHLRNEGYDRVPLHQPQDLKAPMLSLDADASLETFMYSLQAFFPARNEKIVTFLKDHEEICGKSTTRYARNARPAAMSPSHY